MKKLKKKLIFVILGLIVSAGFVLFISLRQEKTGVTHDKHKSITKKQLYHCPMHPTYISERKGDCPICNMKLVPMEQKENLSHESHEAISGISGQATVTITPEREQLIGVKTAEIKKQKLVFTIRATGRIAHDPELYNTIIEYRKAVKTRDEIKKKSPQDEVLAQAESLVNSSYIKLRHSGLSEAQIKEILKHSEYPTNLILVGEKEKTVWVYVQIYEYEIGLVKIGQKIEITSIGLPGKKFSGRIKSVDTYLDEETRTLRIRAEVENPERLLKPDMFVDAIISVDLGDRLAIPEDAVLDTGARQIVFVKKSPGKYEPREVQLGHEANGYYEILSGVADGEEVVTAANFLIDSESKLKSAIEGMGEHKHGE